MAAELLDIIRSEELSRPRSVQRTIGPSGLGVECKRWLLHMIAKSEEPDPWVNWWAWVGTAMHGRLEGIFEAWCRANGLRYLIERRVEIGQVGGETIFGNVDAFDTATGTAIDWKSVGSSSTEKLQRAIRQSGGVVVPGGLVGGWPSRKYRTQLQAYGLGMLLAGHEVRQVMNVYLPRNARSMRDIWFWSEPFNAQVAFDALDRANGLAELLDAVGLDEALAMFADEKCGESHCPWCPKTSRQSATPSTPADPFGLG